MNADLEKSLEELGPGYGEVVARLKNARELDVGRRPLMRPLSCLAAAALLLALVLTIVFRSPSSAPSEHSLPREYAMTVDEMIVSQNPDGSWQNDFLTRRNAEALRARTDSASRIAYKKAMRNLRLRRRL